jgi:hypothetical protein
VNAAEDSISIASKTAMHLRVCIARRLGAEN